MVRDIVIRSCRAGSYQRWETPPAAAGISRPLSNLQGIDAPPTTSKVIPAEVLLRAVEARREDELPRKAR
jgi:hypothetical protein